jgi:hypothetical protein
MLVGQTWTVLRKGLLYLGPHEAKCRPGLARHRLTFPERPSDQNVVPVLISYFKLSAAVRLSVNPATLPGAPLGAPFGHAKQKHSKLLLCSMTRSRWPATERRAPPCPIFSAERT